MHSIALFRSRSRPTLKLGLALLMAGYAALPSASGQGVPPPTLQLSVGSGICPEGWDWQLYLQAHIENRRFFGYEPVILSLDSELPLLGGANYVRGPLWGGYGSESVTAYSAAALPGTYSVTARASTAEWMLEFAEQPSMIDWVTSILGTDLLEATVTKTVTVVGLTEVTDYRQHVAIGDTVNFSAKMWPIDAFEWVWWDWNPLTIGVVTGRQYSRTMNGWGRDPNGVVEVTAMCGNSVVTVPITVYQITGLSASADLVAAGENLIFTATIDPPGGTPPAIEWFVDGVSQGPAATGSTLSSTALLPGHHTVSAKLGTSEQYAGVTVVGIGSVSMSGPDYNGPVALGEIRYIYQNDTYTFTATAAPEGAAWPPNQPQWAINGTTTISPTASGTFGTLSTSTYDFKPALASCGTSTKSIGAIVFNVTGGPVPVASFPGRDTNLFGIGEVIDLKAYVSPPDLTFTMAGLSWEISVPSDAMVDTNISLVSAVVGTGGSTPSAYGPASATSAPPPSAIASVSYIFEPAVYSAGVKRQNQIRLNLTLPIIAPTDALYRKPTGPVSATAEEAIPLLSVTIIGGPLPVHEVNKIMALQALEIYLQPAAISWMNIMFLEGSATIFNTGFIAAESASARNHPEWIPGPVNPPVNATLGCKVARVDLTGYSSPAIPPISQPGESTVKLPLLYQYRNKNGIDVKVQFGTPVDSWKRVDVNGDVNGVKQGQSYGAAYSAPTRTYTLPTP